MRRAAGQDRPVDVAVLDLAADASRARVRGGSPEGRALTHGVLLDIRNFGSKSVDEIKAKLAGMGLALKDTPPGFDPITAAGAYGADDDTGFTETEQY